MSTKNFYVHNGLTVGGLTIDATTSTLVTAGLLITTSTTAATTVTSGALQVSGGAGIAGNLYVGGDIYDGGWLNVHAGNISSYAITSIFAGTNTQVVSSGTGGVIINDTNTLQSVTSRGATSDQIIQITNVTDTTTSTSGALQVSGGVGIQKNLMVGGNAQIWGQTTFAGPVVFNGTSTFVYSTNTYYTDNLINIHVPPTGIGTKWTFDDGKDIGLVYHYYNRVAATDTNAALVLANDTQFLEWYSAGSENSQGDFTGTIVYGTFKTGNIILTSTATGSSSSTGALQIAGGIGVGGNSFIGGNLTVAGTINAQISGVTTTATNLASGTPNQIPYQTAAGATSFFGPGSTGSILVSNGLAAGGPVFTSTASIYVGFAGAVAVTGNVGTAADFYLGIYNTFTGGLLTVGTDVDLKYNPSTNTLFAGTFNGAHSGSGAGLTNIGNGSLVNSSITASAGNAGIGITGSPVSLGGVFTITNLGVTQFLGGTTGLTSTNTTGTVTLTGILGVANGGTNNSTIGAAGTIAYSDGTKYVFLTSSTNGAFLTQGTNAPAWTLPAALSVGTATNLAGITPGAIPIGSTTAGVVSYINTGTVGTVLTMAAGNTATWQAVSGLTGVGQATTATNLAGGNSGTIPIQIGSGQTVFIGSGTNGAFLTQGTNTATWTLPGAMSVGIATTATNIAGGNSGLLHIQVGAGQTAFVASGTNGFVLIQGTNTATFVAQSTLAVGTSTNLAGGTAGLIPIQSAAGATSFINTGAVGTLLSMAVNNTATFVSQASLVVGVSTTATNIAGGNSGLLHIQVGAGQTAFVASGTNGFVLIQGTNTASFVAQASLSVGTATSSTNITGGAAGSIPIQSAAGVTSFIPIGSSGFVLTASGSTATWSPMSGVAAGTASTASNLAAGTPGQVPYQTAAGVTGFYGPGNPGQVLVSGGTAAPVYQSTLTLAGTNVSSNTSTGALVVAGGVGVGGNLNVQGNVVINSTASGFVQNDTGVAVGIGPNNLDTFSTSTYRSAKYVISVSNTWNNTFQTTEALVIHNGTTAFIQQASVFTTAVPIMNFDAVIAAGTVQLQGTATFNTNTVKVQRFYIVN